MIREQFLLARIKDQQIDSLSVDAERHDLQVLQSLNIERYQPKVIAVESEYRFFPDFAGMELRWFLVQYHYLLAGGCGLTFIFTHRVFR